MANLKETNEWSPGIYQLEKNDDVLGGEDGIDNRQATQLAARTNFLKEHVDTLEMHVDHLETGKIVAGKAVRLATARSISITGDAVGSASFDGSANAEIILIHKDSGIQAGNYRQVTVDGKGRVTAGSNPTTLAGLGITDDVALESWVLGLDYARGIQDAAKLANGAQATANYANLPAGTRMPFAQAAAPTGWTQAVDDSTNNRMLRVVNGEGGKVGGVHDPVINGVVPAHTHWFTTGNVSADHSHLLHDPGHTHGVADPGHIHTNSAGDAGSGGNLGSGNATKFSPKSGGAAAATGITVHGAATGVWNSGATSDHTHSGSTDNGSSQTNWQPRYIDMIICVKD